VEVEMGVLEDAAVGKAKAFLSVNPPPADMVQRQRDFLTNQAGAVHLFRTRVSVRNVDPSAYP
jgi:hypothetical protein